MLRKAVSVGLAQRNFTIAMAHAMVFGLIVLTLAGCSDNGQGGPSISSLSTTTDTEDTDQNENAQSDPNPTETAANEQDDPMMSMESPEAELLPDEGAEADLEPPAPTGATARLNWDASSDPNVQGYFIHYGKRSPGEHGSCAYEESQRVGLPPAAITGLEPNTAYFFAISTFGEAESEAETPCSNEIVVVTSAAQG